ncbi:XkdX family protein [Sporolactobacillus shoreicorticis]|uniref:XkdX family protein n=1 Tax=Sporolactobacillus shoreicorticis TaxID=1923877 RepID=A0ABW5RY65_9BACL
MHCSALIADIVCKGFYTNDQMKVFVTAEWITAADYKTIMEQEYYV